MIPPEKTSLEPATDVIDEPTPPPVQLSATLHTKDEAFKISTSFSATFIITALFVL
jgi:hypothetical protein